MIDKDSQKEVKAFVRLKDGRDGRLWIIDQCPYCGKRHTHGAGSFDADPCDYLGDRISHCVGSNYGKKYILVEKKK